MKIKYVSIYDNNPDSGVTKKILYQIDALNNLGIQTELYLLCREDVEKTVNRDYVKYVNCPIPPYKSLIDKIKGSAGIKETYFNLFKTFDSTDIVYLRNHLPTYWFYKLLKETDKKVIIEIVSNKFQEALLRKSYLFYLSLKLFNNAIFKQASAVVSVTRDLVSKTYDERKVKTPYVVIGNGIELENIPARKKETKETDDIIRLTCVANVCKWHGLDLLLNGLKNNTTSYKFHLDIIGSGPEIKNLKQQASDLGIEHLVTFHGFMKGKELDGVFTSTDIGISNLATFRKGIKFTSPLKSREYCARGIPFIYTEIDEDFPDGFPFALRLLKNEITIDLMEIGKFYDKISRIEDVSAKMRSYAHENLTWNKKMLKLYELLHKKEEVPSTSSYSANLV